MERADANPVNPTFCSQRTMALTLGAVAAVAALVAIAALVVLFVPPVTALVGLAASVLYVTGGVSAALAVLAGLEAAKLFCSRNTITRKSFGHAPELIGEVEINKNKYLVLDPRQYEFYTLSQTGKRAEPPRNTEQQKDLLRLISFLKENGTDVISFDTTGKTNYELTPKNIAKYLAPHAIKGKEFLFVCDSQLGVTLCLLFMECLLNKDSLTEKFVSHTLRTIEARPGLIEKAMTPEFRSWILSPDFLTIISS